MRALLAGEVAVSLDGNEFAGQAEVVGHLREVAPDEIRDDLVFLHELLVRARDADGDQVLGIFPALTDPELAGVEGRIADFVAERYGIRYGDGRWHVGAIEGEWHAPGWPRAGSPLTNNRFPYLLDISASNYFSAQFWMGDEAPPGFHRVPPGGRVVLEGEFPRARYFGFHPNDIETNNLPTLRDVDIEPAPGSDNPYRGPVAEGRERRFRVEMVFERRPPDPAPNTLYVGETKNGGPNPAVFLIYRTTGSVLGALPPNNTGVDLPAVTIVDAAGRVVEHFPEVDPYPPGYRPPVDTTRFASLPIPDARALMAPEEPTVRSNWGLPYDILASADISYLSIPYTERLGEVFVCRGRAFTTPRTPEEPVWVPGRDIRAFTVAT
ncbi:MAG: hypothetical protein D6683_12380, partial [Actinomyces sp.]